MPELRPEVGPLTPRLKKVIHTLEWVRIEEFVESTWCGVGSQTAIPLALMTQGVTNCYDLMDAAYCSAEIRSHGHSLGHVPLIDHNPRGNEKIEPAVHSY